MSLIDKIGKIVLREDETKVERKQKKLVWAEGYSEQDLKTYLPKLFESLSKVNQDEELRKTGREGKEFRCPMKFAVIETNSGNQEENNRNIDVAEFIFQELLLHGRQTVTELVKHIGGVDAMLLQIIINALVQDDWLKQFIEKDGTETLELVDIVERNNMLVQEGRQIEQLQYFSEDVKTYLDALPPISAAYSLPSEQKTRYNRIRRQRRRLSAKVKVEESNTQKIPIREVDTTQTFKSKIKTNE